MWEVTVEKYNPFKHTVDHFKYTDFSTKQEVMEYVNDLMTDDHECGVWINDLIDDDGEYFDGPKCLQNFTCKTYNGKIMSVYTLSFYVPGSRVQTKRLYSSLEEVMKLPPYWEQCKNASEFDWSISFNSEVIY